MRIETFALGQLQANCYLIIEDKECIIIDPGDSAEFLLEEIQRQNLKVRAILATHGHFDHIMAVGELQLSLSVPLYIHKNDLFLVKRLSQTARHFLGYDLQVISPQTIQFFEEPAFNIPYAQFAIEVIWTPGHTPGSCSFYIKEKSMLFTGDTLFHEGIGSFDHAYSNKKDLLTSVQAIKKLNATLYPGHD